MRKKKASFKNKALIPIVIVFIVSLLIVMVINYRLLHQTVETKTQANLDVFTDSIIAQSRHLDIILETTKHTLSDKNIAIARSVAYILNFAEGGLSIKEAQKIAGLLDILELDVADAEGTIIYSNYEEGYIGWNYNSTEPTKVYMDLADGTVGEIREEPRTDEVSGDMKHYVGISRTDDAGFIQLGFDANVLKHIKEDISIQIPISETVLGDNGYGLVLTGGIISAHPDNSLIGVDISGGKWYNDVRVGNGFKWLDIDGLKYYAGYKNEGVNTVIGLVPEVDFYKELNAVLLDTGIFMAIAIVFMVIVVYVILGWLLRPIKKLTGSLAEITKGNFDVRVNGDYNYEFDIIKEAVNTLAVGIKSYMNEKLAAERTALESELAKGRAEAAREAVISSLKYASRIQKSLLPWNDIFEKSFTDYSIIWEPRDIVGGDIYWIKKFKEGTVLCVCDCTGHGTPGALLTMLVVSAFEDSINDDNCHDTSDIMWKLEQRLVNILSSDAGDDPDIKDGCDLAILFISKDGGVTISSGHTHVFVCDGNEVTQIKGQKIFIGGGGLRNKDEVKTTYLPYNPDNKFYIASDGLYDQVSGKTDLPFGYRHFKKLILENHNDSQSVISEKIWEAFEEYRGNAVRLDDFELITFKI